MALSNSEYSAVCFLYATFSLLQWETKLGFNTPSRVVQSSTERSLNNLKE